MKKILKTITFFSLSIFAKPVLAQCYVNGQEISCDIFWDRYGWIFILFLFIPMLVISLTLIIKPESILKLKSFLSEKIMGAKYIPSEKTRSIVRLIGVAFLVSIVGSALIFLF